MASKKGALTDTEIVVLMESCLSPEFAKHAKPSMILKGLMANCDNFALLKDYENRKPLSERQRDHAALILKNRPALDQSLAKLSAEYSNELLGLLQRIAPN